MQSIFIRLFCAAALVLSSGVSLSCSDDDPVDANTGKSITDLDIGGDITLDKGQTQQMTATVEYADGTKTVVTTNAELTWSIGDTDIATISQAGVVTGVAVGATRIKANYQGRESSEKALIVK